VQFEVTFRLKSPYNKLQGRETTEQRKVTARHGMRASRVIDDCSRSHLSVSMSKWVIARTRFLPT
jgi:hypothetical protein